MLFKVLSNLLVNSFEHAFVDGSEDNRVEIEVEEQQEQISLSYRDNGIGLCGKSEQQLLMPFSGIDVGTSNTGLGLAIAHSLLRHKLLGEIAINTK